MVILVTKAFINSNPVLCRRKEGRGIDSNDAGSIVNLNINCIELRWNRFGVYNLLNGRIFFYGYFRFRRNSF